MKAKQTKQYVPAVVILPRLRDHNATEDENVDIRSF